MNSELATKSIEYCLISIFVVVVIKKVNTIEETQYSNNASENTLILINHVRKWFDYYVKEIAISP